MLSEHLMSPLFRQFRQCSCVVLSLSLDYLLWVFKIKLALRDYCNWQYVLILMFLCAVSQLRSVYQSCWYYARSEYAARFVCPHSSFCTQAVLQDKNYCLRRTKNPHNTILVCTHAMFRWQHSLKLTCNWVDVFLMSVDFFIKYVMLNSAIHLCFELGPVLIGK